MEKNTLIFGHHQINSGIDFQVPQHIQSKTELLTVLGQILKFPDYYGMNWDALEECLNDLSWLTKRIIVIRHADLPLSNDKNLAKIYLAILNEAVVRWQGKNLHQLLVIFPEDSRGLIESLIEEEN